MFRLSRVPSILALLLVSMEFLSAAPAATGNRVSSEPLPEGGVTGTTPVGEGTVRLYIIDPRGEIEGLLLTDGTQLYVTSRAADQLRRAIKPGDRISIYGLREGHETRIRPDVIRNLSTGTTFIVPLRLDLPLQEQAHLSVTEMQATGQIQVLLIHPSIQRPDSRLHSIGRHPNPASVGYRRRPSQFFPSRGYPHRPRQRDRKRVRPLHRGHRHGSTPLAIDRAGCFHSTSPLANGVGPIPPRPDGTPSPNSVVSHRLQLRVR